MTAISKSFADELADKRMRDAYLAAHTRTWVAFQIRAIRTDRGWSQGELAQRLHTSQSAVSRMEDRRYGSMNINTLLELAATYDCGLVVQFVPYADFLRNTSDLSTGRMRVVPFNAESLRPLYEPTSVTFLPAALPAQSAGVEASGEAPSYITGVAYSAYSGSYAVGGSGTVGWDQLVEANYTASPEPAAPVGHIYEVPPYMADAALNEYRRGHR
jgi:transcriptional regulator with XRE-family HTH domain